jgi:hypothetical protein
MSDPTAILALASSGTLALGVASIAALKGWQGWLELKRIEVRGAGKSPVGKDLANLRDRVRRLETIANGGASGGR